MARWDHNWQGAVQGHSGRRLRRNPWRGGPTRSGKAVPPGGKSAPLNRIVGHDPLTSQQTTPARATIEAATVSPNLEDPEILVPVSLAQAAAGRTRRVGHILDGRARREVFSLRLCESHAEDARR